MYAHPLLWLGLAIVAIVQLEPIWLTLVGEWSDFALLLRYLGKHGES
jgi:hypothetical protein